MRTLKKLILFLCVAMFAGTLDSCKKDNLPDIQEDQPGSIAGLGENDGEPTGTPFRLPPGIELAGKIKGGYSSTLGRSASFDKKAALSDPEVPKAMTAPTRADDTVIPLDIVVGSGTYVKVFLPLKNTTSAPITLTFPAGLILRSVSGECQNGVLLKKTSVIVPTGRIYGVLLLMYCGNANRDASYSSEEYVFAVVSNSSLIVDMCERLKNKRINNEEYLDGGSEYATSSQYYEYKSNLQHILWDLTDYGEALSEEDIAYIAQMENS